MDSVHGLMLGFSVVFQPLNLLYCLIGVFVGTLVGVLPGLGPSATIALLLPTTYRLDPVSSMIMLAGICYGSMYGGSTTSILLNIPGEPSSVITCLDGYQMARKGRAGIALGVSAVGSFIAGTFAVLGLLLLAPALAKMALSFGPPEYLALMIMALSLVTYLARGSIVKAMIMAAIGLFVGTVGMDPMTGTVRFSFKIRELYDGFGLPAVLMGLFGVSEVFENVGTSVKREIYAGEIKGLFGTKQDWKRSAGPITRGTLLGFFLGIFPGVGSIIPTLLSYIIEKKLSRHPEKFGTGEIEGVAAPEACNNAAVGATFIPLMSLGIPSSGMTAMLLAAMMIFGLQPGPLLFTDAPNVFWGVVASMYIGNAMLLILNLPLIPVFVRILKIPYSYLFPLILIFCLIGAYSLNNSTTDIVIMILFGFIGFILKEFGFELPPLILAYVLGPLIETSLRRSLIMSRGSFAIFFDRPISAVFLSIAVIVLILPVLTKKRFKGSLVDAD